MILLTGFEPFGGEAVNPSWLAAEEAARILRAEGLDAVAVQLPCAFGRSLEVLAAAVAEHRPALVVSAGQAGGRAAVSLERVAINCDDARIPDNAGAQPVDEPVEPAGPAACFSTLPVKAALQALRAQGIPAEVSQTAGTYVCNHVFYGLMRLAESVSWPMRGGFVHVPFAPEQLPPSDTRPSLPVGTMAAALAGVVRTALATTEDLKIPAGATH
ncbi:pyroglutamyl-peptidase I [Paenarthrobacter sp. DKR-5]|uniref:pyroglutamyl-peptidase I n=1 Tax=Paenarthrobacter sp. DKR-5 TaxID=2835535 RepID=UPI001BDBE6BF|nr:pyroglutamyl-peptidase I [Paenarthrobacter sp. DKR-5]MBT1002758.1 pyroglutamyl-peptidase I [Paenarthrobacter sp. DKR-5]